MLMMLKVVSRENYLNNHLDQPLSSFRTTHGHLAEVKEQYRQASGGVTERTRTLTEVPLRVFFSLGATVFVVSSVRNWLTRPPSNRRCKKAFFTFFSSSHVLMFILECFHYNKR